MLTPGACWLQAQVDHWWCGISASELFQRTAFILWRPIDEFIRFYRPLGDNLCALDWRNRLAVPLDCEPSNLSKWVACSLHSFALDRIYNGNSMNLWADRRPLNKHTWKKHASSPRSTMCLCRQMRWKKKETKNPKRNWREKNRRLTYRPIGQRKMFQSLRRSDWIQMYLFDKVPSNIPNPLGTQLYSRTIAYRTHGLHNLQ